MSKLQVPCITSRGFGQEFPGVTGRNLNSTDVHSKEKPPGNENRQMVGKPRRLRKEVMTEPNEKTVMPSG
jgi:hypothetical protein